MKKNKTKRKNAPSEYRTYHSVQPILLWFIVISSPVWLFLTLYIAWASLRSVYRENYLAGVLGLIFVISFAYMVYHVIRLTFYGCYLRIDSEGIEFEDLGIYGFVRWDQVRTLGFIDDESYLYTRAAVWGIEVSSDVMFAKNIWWRLNTTPQAFDYFIPLDKFFPQIRRNRYTGDFLSDEKFQQSPIGKDLYRYAPQLFHERDSAYIAVG